MELYTFRKREFISSKKSTQTSVVFFTINLLEKRTIKIILNHVMGDTVIPIEDEDEVDEDDPILRFLVVIDCIEEKIIKGVCWDNRTLKHHKANLSGQVIINKDDLLKRLTKIPVCSF